MTEKHLKALTYTDRDVGRPLIVILTGNHSFTNELESELAFKAQHVSVGEASSLSESIQRDAGIPATFLVNFCR